MSESSSNKHPGQPTQLVHLSDAQFSDLLAGESLDHESEAHLEACAICRTEAGAVLGSVAEFNRFSQAWAEREAPRQVQTPSRWTLRLGAHPAWNAGLMTAAASAALIVGFYLPQRAASPTPAAVAMTQEKVSTPTASDLLADNRLLVSIDQELNYPTQPSVPLADLKGAEHHAPADLREAVAN